MPRARLEHVIEHLRGTENRYQIFTGGNAHRFAPDSAEWFAWLDTLSSFHFTGKHGHLTARQERKPSGEGFWYAYLKAHGSSTSAILEPLTNSPSHCWNRRQKHSTKVQSVT